MSIVTVIDARLHQSQTQGQPVGGTKGGLSFVWTNHIAAQLPIVIPLFGKEQERGKRKGRVSNIWGGEYSQLLEILTTYCSYLKALNNF